MAVLTLRVIASPLLTMAISACFDPDVRNCELSCASQADCASGQRCGPDHLCATPTTQCRARVIDASVVIDAGLPADARRLDAKPHIDAAVDVVLFVAIGGNGTVAVVDGPACGMTEFCELTVPADRAATLTAQPGQRSMFDAWTLGPCAGQGATCTFVPLTDTTLAVQFQKANM
jgi:hypothetical protein